MVVYCCNRLEAHEIAAYIKAHQITDFHDLILDESNFEYGNKCESCHDKGYRKDGVSLKLLGKPVQKGIL